ncbi:hypothetical protein [Streptomyces rubiginosohelvolus]|uniref:Uncharacterized protein n=1 Tax=Streptomyces rubiginosohelvolus TaxID=67362 RepID=A0ABQ3CFN8_9ACTN|nr:hypothetical protein [Streptomyces pluricolorescens]GGZ82343.1 hypothetical protein GCM10010328_66090 [Streptomyces pluricolorescens]
MRRPQLHRPTPNHTWAHPYTGPLAMAVFYNDGGDPSAGGTPSPQDPPKPSPPATRTFTQDEVASLAAKEKAQGERAGARAALEKAAAELGFSNLDDAKAFIEEGRKAQEAQLSEQQKKERELAEREARAEAREKAAEARERTANRRALLVGLGATGDDLDDAAALLRVADDADDEDVQAAADTLKQRRPELFGARPQAPQQQLPPAPHGAPAGTPPSRQSGGSKPGDRGREMARLRGHKPAA